MRGGRKEDELLLSTQLVTLCERAGADSSSQRKIFSHADTSFTVAERHTSARRRTAGASLLFWVLAGKMCE